MKLLITKCCRLNRKIIYNFWTSLRHFSPDVAVEEKKPEHPPTSSEKPIAELLRYVST